jgi:prevent-host-death family protein
MITIPVRELNQNTARVLEQVTASGHPVTVTKNGTPRWQISPVQAEPSSRLEALIQAGLATQPVATLPLPSAPTPVPSGRSVDDILNELDGDE